MNTRELAQRLLEEGCRPSMFAIGSRGAASDAFCLVRDGEEWRVFYTERGQDSPPVHVSRDEAQACDFFFRHLTAMRHDHLVGFFRGEGAAEALRDRLREAGVPSWSDRIPYGGPDDPRHRVFVAGKVLFAARVLLGRVPVVDATHGSPAPTTSRKPEVCSESDA
ncbi:hypothetical protein [Dokdonella sp.]|uniref:hypothetical protein n=1 Tax=Dokdonella sp. TaxID=2291710 RepID=UPI001B18E690|nr:hypothetical protein [Dokdonella sp.]MBO9664818.1 hypothetical protein [Dokdonella sp.]